MSTVEFDWQPDRYVTDVHLRKIGDLAATRSQLTVAVFRGEHAQLWELKNVVASEIPDGSGLTIERIVWTDTIGNVYACGWDKPVALRGTGLMRVQIRAQPTLSEVATVDELRHLVLPEQILDQCVPIRRIRPEDLIEVVPPETPLTDDFIPLGTLSVGASKYVPRFRSPESASSGEVLWELSPPFATVSGLCETDQEVANQIAKLDKSALFNSGNADLRVDIIHLMRRAGRFAGAQLTPAELALELEAICGRANKSFADITHGLDLHHVFVRGCLPVNLVAGICDLFGYDDAELWTKLSVQSNRQYQDDLKAVELRIEKSWSEIRTIVVAFPSPTGDKCPKVGSALGIYSPSTQVARAFAADLSKCGVNSRLIQAERNLAWGVRFEHDELKNLEGGCVLHLYFDTAKVPEHFSVFAQLPS